MLINILWLIKVAKAFCLLLVTTKIRILYLIYLIFFVLHLFSFFSLFFMIFFRIINLYLSKSVVATKCPFRADF